MKHWLNAAVFIIIVGLILPGCLQNNTQKDGRGITPKQELSLKSQIVKKDQLITEQLCRSACLRDFNTALEQFDHNTEDDTQQINDFKNKHPHWKAIQRVKTNQSTEQWVKTISEQYKGLSDEVKQQLRQAINSIKQGKVYQSPTMENNDELLFVLAVPAQDGQNGLVGIIDQRIVTDVHIAQKKNLRIVPYPSESRPRISSIDSDSFRHIDVDHPEDNEDTSHMFYNEVVVKFNSPPTQEQLDHIRKDISAKEIKKMGYTYVFQSQTLSSKQLMNYFKQQDVAYVEPHFLYMTNETPNDPLYEHYQWNLPMIETEAGWNVSRGSSDQIVAVIDTGVDLDHPDLTDHVISGYNFIADHDIADDDVGHGSHVAGVISAAVNNLEGVAGITWHNKILPVKVLDSTGAGSTYSVAQGIIWSTDHGAKVINLSLGNYAEAEFLHDAVKYAFDHDVVLVAATGNDNTDSPGYPAAYPEVLAVSATDDQLNRAVFSNYGSYIDVVAPGVSIASTYMGQQYAALSGTSMASPHVSALASMIRSVNPLLKNTEVMDIIRQTATDLGPSGKDEQFGYGQINIKQALQAAQNTSYSFSYLPKWMELEIERIMQTDHRNG